MLNCDYYNEIKNELINNEVYKRVKDYSKNRNELSTYYNVGKLLSEAGKHYGEGIIENYSKNLVIDVGKKCNKRTFFRIKQFYNLIENQKVSPVATQLTWSHYCELLSIKDINEINVDKNIKTINQDKTIGVIICKKDNGYYIEYSSDSRIYHKEYILN